MRILTTTDELATFIEAASKTDFVTIDTEFLRERTYFAKLCLLQLAYEGDGENDAVLVDPLSEGLSLDPLVALFQDESTVKVFHAARQDLEIFWHQLNLLPKPLFDTQVAAMVCGFGDQVGYETLVKRLADAKLDKSSRFTDWSQRPLTDAQQHYALGDVTHLRQIYTRLQAELERTGRAPWVDEELQGLLDPETYITRPEEAWKRIKLRSSNPRFLAAVKGLAAFRESYAQSKDMPRTRVYKDDALLELASTRPKTLEALGKSRLLLREARKGAVAEGILSILSEVEALPKDRLPKLVDTGPQAPVDPALSDLLRVLLKAKSESAGVAPRLIASSAELDQIASGMRDVGALKGWRRDVFGNDALRLCAGELALAARSGQVELVERVRQDAG